MTNKEAIRRILDHKRVHSLNEPRAVLINEALDLAIKALEERPQGEWIEGENGNIKCNKCGCEIRYLYLIGNKPDFPKFCCDCGAKMKKGGAEDCSLEIARRSIELGRRVGKLEGKLERPQDEWIPITTRPMTEEEEKDACERWGVDHLEDYEKHIFTCQLPADGQEILISTRFGVSLDTCDIDPDYGCGLENNGDWDGVLAWMPLPEPYKVGGVK